MRESRADRQRGQREFVPRLFREAPQFEAQFRKENDDSLVLPHLVMADFTRWFIDLCRQSRLDPERRASAERLAAFLDHEFQAGGEPVDELIGVSFLEPIYQAGDDLPLVRAMLGPVLRRALAEIYPE
jgi:hypothetical protein